MAIKQIALSRIWHRYDYKHTTGALFVLGLFMFLHERGVLVSLFDFFESLQYVGGFLAGILLASFFTAIPAVVLVIDLAQQLDPLALVVLVGFGNTVGDMVFLLFFEEKVYGEMRKLLRKLHIVKRYKPGRKKRSLLSLLVGLVFIVTPLPDDVGIGLLGLSRFPNSVVMVICWGLDLLGAALIVLAARAAGA